MICDRARPRARRRGLRGQELDRAGRWDLTVEDEEAGEAVARVVDGVGLLAHARGGVAEQQVVRRVGGSGLAADDVDVRIVVAVDVTNRERRSALDREEGF